MNTPIYFDDIFASQQLIQLCQDGIDSVVILTDDNVGPLYEKKLSGYLTNNGINVHTISVPAGEQTKTREVKSTTEDNLFSLGCGRDTLILALGGGVITDLAGFVAATYCRGIPAIYIPTSLLAMVDASLGGKTGVNTPFGKNTIGTFTQPEAVFIDVNFLSTLPEHEYLGAMSEIIKHALVCDASYFELIEQDFEKFIAREPSYLTTLISRSCEIKSSIVSADEKEMGKREILNFGHTIAHALEVASEYSISHGAAVAYGLVAESFISNKVGLLSQQEFSRIERVVAKVLDKLKLDVTIPSKQIIAALKFDKKSRKQKNRFVMLNAIGDVFYDNGAYAHHVDEVVVRDAIGYML